LAGRVRARLNPGRRFGLTLGPAFAVLAAVALWRGRDAVAIPLFGISGALLIGSMAFPKQLETVERWWMAFAHLLSRVTTPLLLVVLYFVALTPTGLAMRLFGHNPLVRRAREGSYWVQRGESGDMERQS